MDVLYRSRCRPLKHSIWSKLTQESRLFSSKLQMSLRYQNWFKSVCFLAIVFRLPVDIIGRIRFRMADVSSLVSSSFETYVVILLRISHGRSSEQLISKCLNLNIFFSTRSWNESWNTIVDWFHMSSREVIRVHHIEPSVYSKFGPREVHLN